MTNLTDIRKKPLATMEFFEAAGLHQCEKCEKGISQFVQITEGVDELGKQTDDAEITIFCFDCYDEEEDNYNWIN